MTLETLAKSLIYIFEVGEKKYLLFGQNKTKQKRGRTIHSKSLKFPLFSKSRTPAKSNLKLRWNTRFQRAFTACGCVFKVIGLLWANYFKNVTACSERTLKTHVSTQLYTGPLNTSGAPIELAWPCVGIHKTSYANS
jgi:hypothetical protein